jgi:hypothetical protein
MVLMAGRAQEDAAFALADRLAGGGWNVPARHLSRGHERRKTYLMLEKVRPSLRGLRERRREQPAQHERREKAIRALKASDDLAFVVHANIDAWGRLDPESMYRVLKLRGLI